jgi:hypothetical protein
LLVLLNVALPVPLLPVEVKVAELETASLASSLTVLLISASVSLIKDDEADDRE